MGLTQTQHPKPKTRPLENSEKIDLRSAAFREILGTPPRRIVQYGTVFSVLGFFVVGLFSYIYTYPDIVKAPIKISTAEPPQSVLSPSYGYLENVVAEHSIVEQGHVLAVLRDDDARVQDIFKLEETVEGLEDFEQAFEDFEQDKSLQLGKIETAYLSFVELHKQYKFTRASQFHDDKIDQLNAKIEDIDIEIEILREAIEDLEVDIMDLEGPVKNRIQELISKEGVSSESVRLQRQRIQEVKKLRREQGEREQEIAQKEREIRDVKQQQFEIRQGWKNNNSSAGSDFRQEIIELHKALRKWKEEHLVLAPISGTVYYADLLKSGEMIAKANTRILSIVPTNAEKDIKGKLFISTADAIKVHKEQQVNIRFEAYPTSRYGLLTGVVSDKAAIANRDGKKMITINLDDLITTTQDTIPFEHDMQGFAHIITEERPLLYRFFDYFSVE